MSTYCGALAAGMNAPTGKAVGRPRALRGAWLPPRGSLASRQAAPGGIPDTSAGCHGSELQLEPAQSRAYGTATAGTSLRSTPDIQPCLRESTETRLGEDMLTLRGPKLAALISSGRRKTLYTSESQVCAEVLTFQLCVFTSPVGPYKGAEVMSNDEKALLMQREHVLSARVAELQRELEAARETIAVLEALLQDATPLAKS